MSGKNWTLPGHTINHLQDASIERLVAVAKGSHFIDVIVRVNGEDRRFEADWIKSLVPSNVKQQGEP